MKREAIGSNKIILFVVLVLVLLSFVFFGFVKTTGFISFESLDLSNGFMKNVEFLGGPLEGTAQINASRIDCVAPCAIFFDGIGNLTWREIEEHQFDWDFGAGTENDNSSGGRYFRGYLAAHVYETPGDYNVNLTLRHNHEFADEDIRTIHVLAFSGRTVCVSQTSDFVECPSTNSGDRYTNLTLALGSLGVGERLLIHRGEDFVMNQAFILNNNVVGSYGDGSLSQPYIYYFDSWDAIFDLRNRSSVYDLKIQGNLSRLHQTLGGTGGAIVGANGEDSLVLRINVMVANCFNTILASSKRTFVVDSQFQHCTCDGERHAIQCFPTYWDGDGQGAILNSIVNDSQKASIRSYRDKILLANDFFGNIYENSAIRLYSSPTGLGYALISNLTSDAVWFRPHISLEEGTNPPKNVIVEKSTFRNFQESEEAVGGCGINVVVRNNVGFNTDTLMNYGCSSHVPENNSIYSNTVFSSHISSLQKMKYTSAAKNATLFNNLMYTSSQFGGYAAILLETGTVSLASIKEDYNSFRCPACEDNWKMYVVGEYTDPIGYNLSGWQTLSGQGAHNFVWDGEFLNTPAWFERVTSVYRAYDVSTSLDANNHTVLSGDVDFEHLQVIVDFPYSGMSITSSTLGPESLDLNSDGVADSGYGDADMASIHLNNITLKKNILYGSNRPNLTISLRVSPSTESRIYVFNGSKYSIGDKITREYESVPHNVAAVGSDSFGNYVNVSPPLSSKAVMLDNVYNWKSNSNLQINLKLDGNSDAVSAGKSYAGLFEDHDGNLRKAAPDIGAYEFLSGSQDNCSNGIQDGDETGVDCGGSCQYNCLTFFVDKDAVGGSVCSDSGSGRISQPWCTIQKAADNLTAGQTAFVRQGTYRENVTFRRSGTVGQPLSFIAYPGEKPVLDGSVPLVGWTQAASDDAGLSVQGVINRNYSQIYWTSINLSEIPKNPQDLILFENKEHLFIARYPDQINRAQDIIEDLNFMINLSAEAWNQSDGSANSPLLNCTPLQYYNYSGSQYLCGVYSFIQDSDVLGLPSGNQYGYDQPDGYWDNATVSVYLHSENSNLVYRNVARFNASTHRLYFDTILRNVTPIAYGSGPDEYSIMNHPHVLDNPGEFYISSKLINGLYRVYLWPRNVSDLNKISYSKLPRGFGGYDVDNIVISGFEITGYGGDGIRFYQYSPNAVDSIYIKNNYVHRNNGWGIYLLMSNNSVAENNVVFLNTGGRGIMMNGGNNGTIFNNTVNRCRSTQISFYTMTNSKIVNNTIGSAGVHGNGISVYNDNRNILLSGNKLLGSWITFNTGRDIRVENNIVDSHGAGALNAWGGVNYHVNYTIVHNTLFSDDYFGIVGSNSGGIANWTVYDNIISGRFDFVSSFYNNLYTGPNVPLSLGPAEAYFSDAESLFVNPLAGNLSPISGSPACLMSTTGNYVGALPCVGVEGCYDNDNDNYYAVATGCALSRATDCDDNNANVHPNATEICGNGIDEDCHNGDLLCPGIGKIVEIGFENNPLDSSGYSNDGILYGNGGYAFGRSGQGLRLNRDGYVSIPTVKNYLRPIDKNNFTIAGWFKTDNSGQNDQYLWQNFISTRLYNGQFRICQDSSHCDSIGNVLNNTWYHVAISAAGANWSYYVNGARVISKNYGYTIANFSSDYSFFLGGTNYGNDWNGTIDEFKIYNYALSGSEISELYNLAEQCGQGYANNVSQYNITWYFDDCYRVGQFVNGDWWIVGPITVTNITPEFNGTRNGWEINPTSIVYQPYDSRAYNFNASLVPLTPYYVSGNVSILKTVSNENITCTRNARHICYLHTAAVLTVLDTIPQNNGSNVFRPAYFGTKKKLYLTTGLHTELLPSLPGTASAPNLSLIEERFARVQIDHQRDWICRLIHPDLNMPDYGGDIALDTADAALRLMLNDSVSNKMPALVNYVQYGIDLYGILANGGSWPANGGHDVGRKLPMTFAAVLLDDNEMKDIIRNATTSTFQENGDVYFSQVANNGGGKILFGQPGCATDREYWNVVTYDNAGGSKTCPDPYGYIDGGFRPGDSYDYLLEGIWKATSLGVSLFGEVKTVWNDTDFLNYAEQRVYEGIWTQPDPCAPMDGLCVGGVNNLGYCNTAGENGSVCNGALNLSNGYCNSYCPETGAYCNYSLQNYNLTFGNNGGGNCIFDTNPADGVGRLPLWNGLRKDAGNYRSAFADEMWTKYWEFANGIPVASFTASPQSGQLPLTVQFNASDSKDFDGLIVGYAWNFGDGTIGTGVSPSHLYNYEGAYSVALIVTDNDGKVVSTNKTIMVGDSYHLHEDFELMGNGDYGYPRTPSGLSFENVSGTAYIYQGYYSAIDFNSTFIALPSNSGSVSGPLVIVKEGINAHWSNYTLSVKIGQKYATGGIIIHYTNVSNYYFLNLGTLGNNRLERVAGGAKTFISGTGDAIALGWNSNNSHVFLINVTTNNILSIDVYRDDNLVRHYVDAAPSQKSGTIGFYVLNGSGSGNYEAYDNIDLRFATLCENGIQDSNETGVDCGGSCPACMTPEAVCNDGIDNDNDGAVDAEDNNCYARATIYYVSNSGNDAWSGKSPIWNGSDGPWANKSRIDAGLFLKPGDKVLFKRGNVWYNDNGIRLRKSGNSTDRIYFGAYGFGEKPKIYATSSTSFATFYINNYGAPMIGLTFDGLHLIGNKTKNAFYIAGDDAGGYSDQVSVMNCDLENYSIGVQLDHSSNILLSNNFIHDNADQGILGGATNFTISDNVIFNNGFDCSRPTPPRTYCHNVYLSSSNNLQILRNVIFNGSNFGIIMHGINENITISGNDVYGNNNGVGLDNGGYANKSESFRNVIVEKNKIHNNLDGWTISIGCVQNYTFRNNLIYDNPNGYINIRQPDSDDVPTSGAYFYQNTFYNFSSFFDGWLNFTDVVAKNNLVVCASGNSCFGRLNNLTAHSNNSILSFNESKIYFANVSINNFHLVSGSPAIDQGTNIPVFFDYDGNIRPQGSSWDIGAFEFSAAIVFTCSDGIQNGDESGVDCGGSCAACSSAVSSSGSGGGGGGGGGSLGDIPAGEKPVSGSDLSGGGQCEELWQCSSWSECFEGKQTKSCQDIRNCGTELNKPETIQLCSQNSELSVHGSTRYDLIFAGVLGTIGVLGVVLFLFFRIRFREPVISDSNK